MYFLNANLLLFYEKINKNFENYGKTISICDKIEK